MEGKKGKEGGGLVWIRGEVKIGWLDERFGTIRKINENPSFPESVSCKNVKETKGNMIYRWKGKRLLFFSVLKLIEEYVVGK